MSFVFTKGTNLMILKKVLVFICLLLLPQIILANETNPQCYSYLTELVRSSNFPFKGISKEANNLLIDTDDHNTVLAQVNYNKQALNVSSDTNTMAINGWVKYDVKLKKLYNVSADIDPDYPAVLSFDKKYADLFENCRKGVSANTLVASCTEINKNSLLNQTVFSPKKELIISQVGRTYFYSAPDENCKIDKNLFIIKNDHVEVLGEFKEFYNVIYHKRNGDNVTGWISKNNAALPQENKVTDLFNKYKGDVLVSEKSAVEIIDKSCTTNNIYNRSTEQVKQDNQRCILSKITFPYDQFLNLGNTYHNDLGLVQGNKVYIWQSNNFNGYIKETKRSLAGGNYYVEVTLFTEKNNKIIDQLIIYKEQHDIDAYTVKHQYYFISSSLVLSILEVSTTEEGILLDSWRNYKIGEDGKIILIESMACDESVNGKNTCYIKPFPLKSNITF